MRRPVRTVYAVMWGVVLLLLLCQHARGTALGEDARGAGEALGEDARGAGEEEEQGGVGDRSAQIIRRQDAEEGEGGTAWRGPSPGVFSDTAAGKGQLDSVNLVHDPSSQQEPRPDKTLCRKPSPPEHGWLEGKDYDDGGVVLVFCLQGYRLSGPPNITCVPVSQPGARGVWIPQEEYKCLPLTPPHSPLCEKPVPPDNGYLKGNNYEDGGVVLVLCEEGYRLSGPPNITCRPVPFPGARGVWVPQDEYTCLPDQRSEVEVQPLGERKEAQPRYSVYHTNTFVIGGEAAEKRAMTLFDDVRCDVPTAPLHGSVQGTDNSIGATVRYACDEGFTLIGPTQATCLAVPDPFHHVGIWEPQTTPTCTAPPPSTLPLMLVQPAAMARVVEPPSHRLTQAQTYSNYIEGLPTVCSLPKVVGPCKAALPRFYFDSDQLECLPFNYGGCRGNENNFETYEACQNACR